ncbi:MAG: DUF3667 domain-containing protein [Phenylobacterium sp.]|uniref:DUF3667 domain-containing protein n=1 Tax=Phenylobacterium sp. TaxID=1871053 RepID=UPI0025DA3167|nr:DUF3667 domain-containing protein [Phenylobacterium sp.]MBI1200800.1 DUF3667 domain-containing protein [Phenylobacterium sp.]
MVDLDAVGGAATGGLIASTFEKPAGKAGEPHGACADCGTETVGRFCHNCGNPSHVHRTLLHLGEELLHGVMHFDSRTWRTLPMLFFRPGKLTREWCLGKRARYVSPLAIFLFTVFVMFMLISYMPKPAESPLERQVISARDLSMANTELANAKAALSKAQAKFAAATTSEARAEAAGEVKGAEGEVKGAEAGVKVVRRQISLGETGVVAGEGWKEDLARNVKSGELKINTGNKKLDEKLKHKLENPDLAIYKLQQTFYKFSFLLVPISIPFVAVLFLWKKNVTLYDHGVFVLYSLTFVSLLVMATFLAGRAGGAIEGWVFAIAPFLVPAHMFAQLKGAYSLSIFSALWRTFFLLVFSSIALALFVLAIIWLGLG